MRRQLRSWQLPPQGAARSRRDPRTTAIPLGLPGAHESGHSCALNPKPAITTPIWGHFAWSCNSAGGSSRSCPVVCPPQVFCLIHDNFLCPVAPLCLSSRRSLSLVPSRSPYFFNLFCINLHLSVIRLRTRQIHVDVQNSRQMSIVSGAAFAVTRVTPLCFSHCMAPSWRQENTRVSGWRQENTHHGSMLTKQMQTRADCMAPW